MYPRIPLDPRSTLWLSLVYLNLSVGVDAALSLSRAAYCDAMFHKCPLNNFWDCTVTCDVTYLAHTLNNSYPTSACMWVLYKAIKSKVSSQNVYKLCRLCSRNGRRLKSHFFPPNTMHLDVRAATAGNVDSWNIFVNEHIEIFLGRISLPQLCYKARNNATWRQVTEFYRFSVWNIYTVVGTF